MAAQLRKPSGPFGRVFLTPALNRGNATTGRLVLGSLQLGPDDQALEVGFGGGDLVTRMLLALPTVCFWQQPEVAASELFWVLNSGGRLVIGFSPPGDATTDTGYSSRRQARRSRRARGVTRPRRFQGHRDARG